MTVDPLGLMFGDLVRLTARCERFLVDDSGIRESGQRKNMGRYDRHPLPWALAGWPGSPVPLDAGTPVDDRFVLEPDVPAHPPGRGVRRLGRPEARVRWRRVTALEVAAGGSIVPAWLGLVVGVTVRHEGVIVPGWDDEPPCWHSERRIEMIEVVLRTPDLRCRAAMALALPGDVVPL